MDSDILFLTPPNVLAIARRRKTFGEELRRRDAQRSGRLLRRVSRLRLRMNIDDIHFGTHAISMGAAHA